MMPEHDADLVRRTLAGDDEAFEELVSGCQTSLFNVALRFLGNRQDARDVVQTAFIKAYTRLHTFDPRRRFFSWIHRIVINEALNALKRRRRHEPLDDALPAPSSAPPSFESGQLNRFVQEGLMRLPVHYREVIVLRYYSELSHREISEVVGVPEKTVKSRLFSARKLLVRDLLHQGLVTK